MFRPAASRLLKTSAPRFTRSAQARRLLTTAPPHKTSRSWKNSAARWGLAGGLLYYYNTSSVFADEPAYTIHAPPTTETESEELPTLDSIATQRQSKRQSLYAPESAPLTDDTPTTSTTASTSTPPATEDDTTPGTASELEEEAEQQGAFNEETGEINWDCPCLGGMAHGPCGPQFREAFSCFVYSKEEPKGVDCIDKFKGMQDCFRLHPEVYGAELEDEVEEEARAQDGMGEGEGEGQGQVRAHSEEQEKSEEKPEDGRQKSAPTPRKSDTPQPQSEKISPSRTANSAEVVQGQKERGKAATQQVRSDHGAQSESEALVPKAAHDAT